ARCQVPTLVFLTENKALFCSNSSGLWDLLDNKHQASRWSQFRESCIPVHLRSTVLRSAVSEIHSEKRLKHRRNFRPIPELRSAQDTNCPLRPNRRPTPFRTNASNSASEALSILQFVPAIVLRRSFSEKC